MPQQWHRYNENHEISNHVEGGYDCSCDVGVDASPGYNWIPVSLDRYALEDCTESLSRTLAEDEDANAPQSDYEGPANGKIRYDYRRRGLRI